MAAVNLSITYPPASTVSSIMNTLLDAFESSGAFAGAGNGLGFTQIEDSIAGSSIFVVQAQQPSEAKSQMVIEVRHANIAALDYLAFVVWESWAAGAPGVGTNSVQVTDPTTSPTTNEEERFHLIDLTNGGDFFFDADDTDGRWLAVHSKANGVENKPNHFVCVCSIEKSSQPNYGVLAWHSASIAYYLKSDEDANGCLWIPPVNHIGNNSNTHAPAANLERAAYQCHAPVFAFAGTTDLNTSSICGAAAGAAIDDTYNGEDLVYPLYIHNSTSRIQSNIARPAGVAFGFRGFARGIFGFRRGSHTPRRFNLDDIGAGLKYIAYATDPDPTLGVASVPRYAVERA